MTQVNDVSRADLAAALLADASMGPALTGAAERFRDIADNAARAHFEPHHLALAVAWHLLHDREDDDLRTGTTFTSEVVRESFHDRRLLRLCWATVLEQRSLGREDIDGPLFPELWEQLHVQFRAWARANERAAAAFIPPDDSCTAPTDLQRERYAAFEAFCECYFVIAGSHWAGCGFASLLGTMLRRNRFRLRRKEEVAARQAALGRRSLVERINKRLTASRRIEEPGLPACCEGSALALMTPAQRDVWIQVEHGEMSQAEIARDRGCTCSYISKLLCQAAAQFWAFHRLHCLAPAVEALVTEGADDTLIKAFCQDPGGSEVVEEMFRRAVHGLGVASVEFKEHTTFFASDEDAAGDGSAPTIVPRAIEFPRRSSYSVPVAVVILELAGSGGVRCCQPQVALCWRRQPYVVPERGLEGSGHGG